MFYVYVYIDPRNNIPFYVGKGNGDRYKDHIRYVLRENYMEKHNFEKYSLVKEILDENLQPIVEFKEKNLDEESAFRLETYWIKKIGRKITNDGPLLNLTDGGEGFSGYKHTKEAKRKIGEKSKEIWSDPEYRKKMSELHKGHKHSEEQKRKISEALKGKRKKPFSKEHIKNISESHKGKMLGEYNPFYGKKHSDEVIKKIIDANKGKKHTEETRRKMSESHKRRYEKIRGFSNFESVIET